MIMCVNVQKGKKNIKKENTAKYANSLGYIFLAGVIIILAFVLYRIIENENKLPNTIINATVIDQSWETSVQVIGTKLLRMSDWIEKVPMNAEDIKCSDKVYQQSDKKIKGSVEVCNDPYSLDSKNGNGTFVNGCVYEVYRPYCEYSVYKEIVLQTKKEKGEGLIPVMPAVDPQYKKGIEKTTYMISARGDDGKIYSYFPRDINEYKQFAVNDRLQLEITSFGIVTNVEKEP